VRAHLRPHVQLPATNPEDEVPAKWFLSIKIKADPFENLTSILPRGLYR